MTARMRRRMSISFATMQSVSKMVSKMEQLQNMSATSTLVCCHREAPCCEMRARNRGY